MVPFIVTSLYNQVIDNHLDVGVALRNSYYLKYQII